MNCKCKNEKNCSMVEAKDYFQFLDEVPNNVKQILKKYESMNLTYENCDALVEDLFMVDWNCEYYLDAIPYNLRPLNEDELKLSDNQKETMKNGCPECGGSLHIVENTNETELYLWCNDCDVSVDSSGGYIC